MLRNDGVGGVCVVQRLSAESRERQSAIINAIFYELAEEERVSAGPLCPEGKCGRVCSSGPGMQVLVLH